MSLNNETRLPDYDDYCRHVTNEEEIQQFLNNRNVPDLSITSSDSETPKLLQVHAMIRHGARTAVYTEKCFPNYDPFWYCQKFNDRPTERLDARSDVNRTGLNKDGDVVVGERSRLNPILISDEVERRESIKYSLDGNTMTDEFWNVTSGSGGILKISKKYLTVGGSCPSGELLLEGFKQHHLLGKSLANHYFNKKSKSFFVNLNKLNANSIIYFRSTDVKRTLFSGSSLLTSMISESDDSNVTDLINELTLTVYTSNRRTDWLDFTSGPICKTLKELQEEFTESSEFQKWNRTNFPFIWQISRLTGPFALSFDDSPIMFSGLGRVQDCLRSTYCQNRQVFIPKDFYQNVIINITKNEISTIPLMSVPDVLVREMTSMFNNYKNRMFPKLGSRKIYREWKINMLKMWASHRNISDISVESMKIFGPSEVINSSVNLLNLFYNSYGREIPLSRAFPFLLYSAHDSTLFGMTGALGDITSVSPEYASIFIMELYELKEIPFVRVVYNGLDVTARVCEVEKFGLCKASDFFKATTWADLENDSRLCLDRTPTRSEIMEVASRLAPDGDV